MPRETVMQHNGPRLTDKMQAVLTLMRSGRPVAAALAAVLGGQAAFAARHGFAQSAVSACFNAYQWRPAHDIRDAAAFDLGAPRSWIDALIDGQKSRTPEPESVRE